MPFVCGQSFEIEPGFWYGTGFVSYALSVAVSVATFIAESAHRFSLEDNRCSGDGYQRCTAGPDPAPADASFEDHLAQLLTMIQTPLQSYKDARFQSPSATRSRLTHQGDLRPVPAEHGKDAQSLRHHRLFRQQRPGYLYPICQADKVKNSFHARDREGVYLIVSQLNGCEYCLASHTASAIKGAGLKEAATRSRSAPARTEKKWQVIYGIVRSAIENKGTCRASATPFLGDFLQPRL